MTVARLRPLAESDLVERSRHYTTEGGTDLGVRFFDVAVASLRAIEKMPSLINPQDGDVRLSSTHWGERLNSFRASFARDWA